MTNDELAELNLQGWAAALIQTGYEKAEDLTTNSGNTVTVYQNKELGKLAVLIAYKDSDDWVAFYPAVGWWNDQFHVQVPGEGTCWIDKTAAELVDEANELADDANGSSSEGG